MEEVKALRRCSNIRLLTIEADKPSVWNVEDATHIRVSLPANIQYLYEMQKMGYQFVERMLHVTIPLSKSSIEYDRLIRIKPVALHDHKEEIKEIARSSFTSDRRFHVTLQYDQKIANEIIDSWIDEINEFYVSEYKGKIIGFLALKEQDCGK